MTNVEARFSNSLRPRKPEGLLGRTAQDGHLDSHTAPELCNMYADYTVDILTSIPVTRLLVVRDKTLIPIDQWVVQLRLIPDVTSIATHHSHRPCH